MKKEKVTKYTRHTHRSEYDSWKNAKGRCNNPKPKDAQYAKITFSKRFEQFHDFMAHIGPKQNPKWTVDRIDNNRGYVPGNVRWASKSVQATNRKPTIFVEHAGRKLSLKEWGTIFGISPQTLYGRYHRGDRDPSVLFRPVIKSRLEKRKSHRSKRRRTRTDIKPTAPVEITEAQWEAATANYNIERGAPEEFIAVRNTDCNRERFFRHARRIETHANEDRKKQAEAVRKRMERIEKEARHRSNEIRYLEISTCKEAKRWRDQNGVSHDEAIRMYMEIQKAEEESDREHKLNGVSSTIAQFEQSLQKRHGIRLDVSGLLLTLNSAVPELSKHFDPMFLEGLKRDVQNRHSKKSFGPRFAASPSTTGTQSWAK